MWCSVYSIVTRLTLPSSPRLSPYTTHTTELTTSVSIHDSHYRAHHVCLHTRLTLPSSPRLSPYTTSPHVTPPPPPPHSLPDGSPPHSSFSRRHAPPPPPFTRRHFRAPAAETDATAKGIQRRVMSPPCRQWLCAGFQGEALRLHAQSNTHRAALVALLNQSLAHESLLKTAPEIVFALFLP